MKQRFYSLFCVLLIASLLAGCRLSTSRNATDGAAGAGTTPTLAVQPTATARAIITPSPLPSPQPTATQVSPTALAVQAAQDYFAALQSQNFTTAVNDLSAFSLAVFNMSSGDAIAALQGMKASGGKWSDLQVLDNRVFDAQTVLVHVRYQYTSLDPKTKQPASAPRDEQWPIRNESGTWRYNWGNLIDFRTLATSAQTVSGITILPQQLMRYSDRIQLLMLMQNNTSQPFVFGQPNEILAQFHFGDKVVPAQKTQIILEPLRSTPDVAFDVPGLFDSFPDSVEIRKWKNLNTPPWFVFNLGE